MSANCDISYSIWSAFLATAEEHKEKIAVASDAQNLSFLELKEMAESIADSLDKAGIRKGDFVSHMMPSSVGFVALFLALCKLSTIIGLVSNKYQNQEIGAIATKLHPNAWMTNKTDSEKLSRFISLKNKVEVKTANNLMIVNMPDEQIDPNPSAVNEPIALVKFTSGSTGQPKGVALTASNLTAGAKNIISTLSISSKDIILAPIPISHSYGFDLGLLSMIFSGATLIIQSMFIPRMAIQAIEKYRVTLFLGVPSMYHIFADMFFDMKPNFSKIRCFLSCTAPLSVDLYNRFNDRFDQPIYQHYGSSETGAAANQPLEKSNPYSGSVGRALDNVAINVIDENGDLLKPGLTGEIMISGDSVASGYLMGRPKGEEQLSNNRYKTGDLGRIDENGYLFIEGRKDSIINVGGNKVSPSEVISLLEKHEAIKEASVIGMTDNDGEEYVYAAVTLRSEAEALEQILLDYCRGNLAAYKIPRRIEILHELPRNATGKISLRPEDYRK